MPPFWQNLSKSARAGLVAGVVIIALGFTAALWWALHRDQEVLFSNLSPQDASAMVAELDRMKVPYTLESGGTTI